jgi:hypothetical protein
MVHDTLHKDLQLSKISQLSDQNGLLLDEKGAIQDNKMFVQMNAAVS